MEVDMEYGKEREVGGGGEEEGGFCMATAVPPTAISHSLVACFSSADDLNLIVCKCDRMEIFLITPSGLCLLVEKSLYGTICSIERVKVFNSPDMLVVVTKCHSSFNVMVLAYDKGENETKMKILGFTSVSTPYTLSSNLSGIYNSQKQVFLLYGEEGVFFLFKIGQDGSISEGTEMWLGEGGEGGIIHLSILDEKAEDKKEKERWGGDMGLVVVSQWSSCYVVSLYWITKRKVVKQKDVHSLNDVICSVSSLPSPHPSLLLFSNTSITLLPHSTISSSPRYLSSPSSPPPPFPSSSPSPFLSSYSMSINHDRPLENNSDFTLSIPPMVTTALGRIDEDGSRWLAGDHRGALWIFVAKFDEKKNTTSLSLRGLGRSRVCSTITYLDNGFLFLGSKISDSLIIRLSESPSPSPFPFLPSPFISVEEDGEEGEEVEEVFFEVVDCFSSLCPILDMCLISSSSSPSPNSPSSPSRSPASVKKEKGGKGEGEEQEGQQQEEGEQGKLVVCCGGVGSGSIREVRSGVTILPQARIDIGGVSGVWSISQEDKKESDLLCFSLTNSTHVLSLQESELSPLQGTGHLISTQQTLHFSTFGPTLPSPLPHGILQITPSSVLLHTSSPPFSSILGRWDSPSSSSISVCAASFPFVLLGVGCGEIICLQLERSCDSYTFVSKFKMNMGADVACLSLLPPREKGNDPELWSVGLWDETIRLLPLVDLPTTTTTSSSSPSSSSIPKGQPISCHSLPRSLLFQTFGGVVYLFVGFGDGSLVYYWVEDGALSHSTRLSLATQPIQLFSVKGKDQEECIFACSERSTLIFCRNKRLVFANTNLPFVTSVCNFRTETEDNLVLVNEQELIIGLLEEMQKVHIRTTEISGLPHFIRHVPFCGCFVVVVSVVVNSSANEEGYEIRLYDDLTFELKSTVKISPHRQHITALNFIKFSNRTEPYIVIGTSILPSNPNQEVKAGCLVVFDIVQGKLKKLASGKLSGGVVVVDSFDGGVVVGAGNLVQLWRFNEREEEGLISHHLSLEDSYKCGVAATHIKASPPFILVADLLNCTLLLTYKEGIFVEVASSLNANNWLTCVSSINEDIYLTAQGGEISVLSRDLRGETKDLLTGASFHLGLFVNQIKKGALSSLSSLPGEVVLSCPSLVGTAEGGVCVLAKVNQKEFSFLMQLEKEMEELLDSACFSHRNWRKRNQTESFVDLDFIETFLQLPQEKNERIAEKMDISVEKIVAKILGLVRKLH